MQQILVCSQKKQTTVIGYNKDKPSNHIMWRKPDAKKHILYNSIGMKCPEKTVP